ncbi:MAG: chloride channel protein [Myxococcota bacterium]
MEWSRLGAEIPVDRAQRVGRLLLLAALVGVLAGLGAALFELAVSGIKYGLLDGLAGYRPPAADGDHPLFGHTDQSLRPWMLALLPVVGGLLGGILVYGFAPDADGPGTEAAIDAYHHRRGLIRGRVPLVKTLASALTLGTGGSAGREGPIALVGAGIGSLLARVLRLGVRERRMLMVAGMAAGIGAIFRAPLAAALFSAEVLYREMDMEFEIIVPSVISSIVAFSTFTLMFGAQPLFATPGFSFDDPRALLPYTLLALACAAGAWSFARVFKTVKHVFHRLPVPLMLKPALGGLVVGAFALLAPETIGSGYGFIQQAFSAELSLGLLLMLTAGKMVTTSFTVGSGQSGGVFGPAVVIGGGIGGLVALASQAVMPGISPAPGAFIMVGMAGFFSGAANTPLSSIIMVSEMTGNYRLLVPAMWVCVISFLLVRRSTLYPGQAARRSASPVHLGEMMQEVLEGLSVSDAMRLAEDPLVVVHAGTPLRELAERFSTTHHACFPVVDPNGRMVGVVDDDALRVALCTEGIGDFVVAHDLVEKAPVLYADETLNVAIHKMVTSAHDELVVVERTDSERPVGALSRRDVIAAYDHQIHAVLDDTASTLRAFG